MTARVDGKIVIVTGGTQGLGEATARHLAEQGAEGLVICGRNRANGERVAREIGQGGCRTVFVPCDLQIPDQCRAVVKEGAKAFGRIDGLVNAGALTNRGTIEETSVELWDMLFNVNVRAPFILTQECVRLMKMAGRGGSIVNIITMSSHGGQPFLVPYSASKGALAVLTKNNAHALRGDRIRVNGINVGWMDTPAEHAIQHKDGNPPDWLPKAEARQPFGRLIKPIDVARLTAYLISQESEIMTGALIDFDQNVMGAYS